jgi:hypothetical protein
VEDAGVGNGEFAAAEAAFHATRAVHEVLPIPEKERALVRGREDGGTAGRALRERRLEVREAADAVGKAVDRGIGFRRRMGIAAMGAGKTGAVEFTAN